MPNGARGGHHRWVGGVLGPYVAAHPLPRRQRGEMFERANAGVRRTFLSVRGAGAGRRDGNGRGTDDGGAASRGLRELGQPAVLVVPGG